MQILFIKKILALISLIFISFLSVTAHPFAGGDGTKDNPYLISTPQQLDSIRWYIDVDEEKNLNTYWRMINDIDMDVAPYNQGEGWQSFPFEGHFNGAGYAIKNLYSGIAGLFTAWDATIDSLGIVNCNLKDHAIYIDWFNMEAERRIANCYLTGKITGNNIAVFNVMLGYVYKCYVDADIEGSEDCKGIFAFSTGWELYVKGNIKGVNNVCAIQAGLEYCYVDANIEGKVNVGAFYYAANNCYSTGTIRGDSLVGGIVGVANYDVSNCYSTATIYGKFSVGGIAGALGMVNMNSSPGQGTKVTNCYFNGNIYDVGYDIGGIVGDYIRTSFVLHTPIIAYDSVIACVNMGNIDPQKKIISSWVNRIVGDPKYEITLSGKQKYSSLIKMGKNHSLDSVLIFGYHKNNYKDAFPHLKNGGNQDIQVLKSQYFYEYILGWDFDNVWKMCDNYDYPIFQWQDCNSAISDTNISSVNESSIKLYPNPVNTEINCEFNLNKAGTIRISIVDLSGRELSKIYEGFSDMGLFRKTFLLHNIAKGSYLLCLKIGSSIRYAKFIKE